MFLTVFALALTAHLISDFLFQTERTVQNRTDLKSKTGWRAMLTHAAGTFCLNLAALYFLLDGWWPFLAAVGITAAHACIDALKDRIRCKKRHTLKFVIDQLLHVAVIAAMVYVVSMNANKTLTGFYSVVQPLLLLPGWSAEADKTVWTIVVGLACTWGGAYVIRCILKDLNISFAGASGGPENDKSAHTGKLIGILERMAILILIPLNQWAAAGLLLTAKSIARHENLNDKSYAEYYLIGTLLSLIIALVGGLLISAVWAPAGVAA